MNIEAKSGARLFSAPLNASEFIQLLEVEA